MIWCCMEFNKIRKMDLLHRFLHQVRISRGVTAAQFRNMNNLDVETFPPGHEKEWIIGIENVNKDLITLV